MLVNRVLKDPPRASHFALKDARSRAIDDPHVGYFIGLF